MPRSATKYDGVLISPPIFITATNTSGHRKLYPVFKDKTDPDVHLVQCDECGRFISLPGSKSLVRMERHTRSKECSNLKTKNERWKLQDQVRAEAEAALLSSGLVHRLVEPPARPRVQPRPIVEARTSHTRRLANIVSSCNSRESCELSRPGILFHPLARFWIAVGEFAFREGNEFVYPSPDLSGKPWAPAKHARRDSTEFAQCFCNSYHDG